MAKGLVRNLGAKELALDVSHHFFCFHFSSSPAMPPGVTRRSSRSAAFHCFYHNRDLVDSCDSLAEQYSCRSSLAADSLLRMLRRHSDVRSNPAIYMRRCDGSEERPLTLEQQARTTIGGDSVCSGSAR